MDGNILKALLEGIHGCTFATLDATCEPKPGIALDIHGERVILYRTSGMSGYEARVKRMLAEAGKDPDSFKVGALPWGERVDNLPLILLRGKLYLQTVTLSEGKQEFYIRHTNPRIVVDPSHHGIRPPQPLTERVSVRTYNISSLTRLTLLGETLDSTSTTTRSKRAILKLSKS